MLGFRFSLWSRQGCLLIHKVEHQAGMFEYITLGVELKRLFLPDHGQKFRQDVFEQTDFTEVFKRIAGFRAFNKSARELHFNPFGAA